MVSCSGVATRSASGLDRGRASAGRSPRASEVGAQRRTRLRVDLPSTRDTLAARDGRPNQSITAASGRLTGELPSGAASGNSPEGISFGRAGVGARLVDRARRSRGQGARWSTQGLSARRHRPEGGSARDRHPDGRRPLAGSGRRSRQGPAPSGRALPRKPASTAWSAWTSGISDPSGWPGGHALRRGY